MCVLLATLLRRSSASSNCDSVLTLSVSVSMHLLYNSAAVGFQQRTTTTVIPQLPKPTGETKGKELQSLRRSATQWKRRQMPCEGDLPSLYIMAAWKEN